MSDLAATLADLKARLATVHDLHAAEYLLSWDQQTLMPEAAIETRAEQLGTLARLAHEHFVAPAIGEALAKLDGQLDPASDDGALVRVTRRDYDRETRLPAELVAANSRAAALAEPAWGQARAESRWELFAPHLAELVRLKLQVAECLGYEDHPFDALIAGSEPGLTKVQIESLFRDLRAELVPLVKAIAAQRDDTRDAPLRGPFDEAKQEAFGREVVAKLGYDWSRGRQDRSRHPFCVSFSADDVRITTRFDPNWLSPALFGTLHEAGHGMYEQGVDRRYARTPLSGGCSMSVHESQSRLWENLVGRSRAFWQHFYPRLQATFPERLGGVELEAFYRAINTSAPTLIRVEADEVTYNLHVLLRFELELALLDGGLKVEDVPAAWNTKMAEYLGVTPPNDAQGALQDIHWAAGLFAYFPTYTLGTVLSVQLFETAVAAHPNIPGDMARGEFGDLLAWLRHHVHRFGRKHDPNDLVLAATGRALEIGPYVRYLRAKYGELYALD